MFFWKRIDVFFVEDYCYCLIVGAQKSWRQAVAANFSRIDGFSLVEQELCKRLTLGTGSFSWINSTRQANGSLSKCIRVMLLVIAVKLPLVSSIPTNSAATRRKVQFSLIRLHSFISLSGLWWPSFYDTRVLLKFYFNDVIRYGNFLLLVSDTAFGLPDQMVSGWNIW